MKVAFFGQSGPYAPLGLATLLSQSNPFEVALVVEGRKFPMGRQIHRWLAPAPRALPGTESLADTATALGIEVLQTADVNATAVANALRARHIDCLVCVGFDRLFAPALLAAVPVAINAHPSALPQLRGPAPLFWLLRDGVRQTAMTLHGLDAREDHGPIFAQAPWEIPPRVSGEALYNVAARLAGRMLASLLSQAASGPLQSWPQIGTPTRAPRPKAEDACIEPATWDCGHLVDFACGAPYFRSAWMRLGDSTFHLKTGFEAQVGAHLPGEYVLQGDILAVRCRDGVAQVQVQT